MRYYLNLDKISPAYAMENRPKFLSCHFLFATDPGDEPCYDFHKKCREAGILVEKDQPCNDLRNAREVLRILWDMWPVRFAGITSGDIAPPAGNTVVLVNTWSTRGGYSDGNFHTVHRTDYYWVPSPVEPCRRGIGQGFGPGEDGDY